jgi:hypothetical protein
MKSHRISNLKNYRIFKIPNFNFHYEKEELDYEKADKSTFLGALRIKLQKINFSKESKKTGFVL